MCFKTKIKEINPKLNISSKEIVAYQEFKKNRIFLGTKIKIPRNFVFAICSNYKVLDTLYEGITEINIHLIPNATKKFSLYKLDKKNKAPKYFQGEGYFINLNTFEKFEWETSEYAELEDKNYGEYKTSCLGELNFKIFDPVKFLNHILNEVSSSIDFSNQVEKYLRNFINERIVRILNKLNPTARSLYLKEKELVKLIYEKLSDLLKEIGIDLDGISLTETRFPPKIITDLEKITEEPIEMRGWGKNTFEEWQSSNPSPETNKKPKFVTVTPTKSGFPFFKESMPPYFFDEEETNIPEVVESNSFQEEVKKPIWKGIDEKAIEEQSKKLVDLDNIEEEESNKINANDSE